MPYPALREPMSRTPKTDKVEFMAAPAWVKKFEKEADRLGLSLSAYIRLACEEKYTRDHRDDGR